MALHPVEDATLRAFVVAAKRDRLLTRLGNPKRRKHALDSLNHFTGWDARFAQPVDSAVDMLALLHQVGAPLECHVISGSRELDGRDMALGEAVSACEDFFFASVLCCVPGEIAFFFDEVYLGRNRILLRRLGRAG